MAGITRFPCWNTLTCWLAGAVLAVSSAGPAAGAPPSALLRPFGVATMQSAGLAGDLVAPPGTTSRFTFDSGRVLIGEGAGPEPMQLRSRNRAGRSTAGAGSPRLQVLLNGVADANGTRVVSGRAQVVVDVIVSPNTAGAGAPPFAFPVDIEDGVAFADASLPVVPQAAGAVRIQILGVTVLDPDGRPLAVLGFEIPAVPAAPSTESTPTPTTTPKGEGPMLTPTPDSCAEAASCAGPCSRTCDDGTVVVGQCTGQAGGSCVCSALCTSPTPCGIGECFDTAAQRCTGRPCDSALRCPSPSEICDAGGLRCPCRPAPPPLPRGQICCQCAGRTPGCFDFGFAEVQPICPPGCETFLGRECDATADTCVPLTPCAADKDCNDDNPCTIDHCTTSGCTHECICVGAGACGPGPARR